MARPRNRQRYRYTSDFLLYSADMAAGWRVIQRVSFAYGEHRARLGEFRRHYDGFGQLIGYQAVEQRLDTTVESDASRAALGRPEMLALSGLLGQSRTAGLREMDRVGRHHPVSGRLLPEEDFVERTRVLVREIYPQSANFHSGDRAVRVYPKG